MYTFHSLPYVHIGILLYSYILLLNKNLTFGFAVCVYMRMYTHISVYTHTTHMNICETCVSLISLD